MRTPMNGPTPFLPENLPDGSSRHDARDPDEPIALDGSDAEDDDGDEIENTGDPANVDDDTIPFDVGDDATDAKLF